jgi:hypothetical protein
MRGPKDGTGTLIRPCVGGNHCPMVAHSKQLTASERTPLARMLPSVMGEPRYRLGKYGGTRDYVSISI